MPDLNRIKRRIAPFGKGLMMELVPGIAAGTINEFFHQWHVDVPKITEDVQNNRSLWGDMEPEKRRQLGLLSQKVGNLDFITPEFLIDSIRKDFPGVASLFINWEPAMEWLIEQLEDIKCKIQN